MAGTKDTCCRSSRHFWCPVLSMLRLCCLNIVWVYRGHLATSQLVCGLGRFQAWKNWNFIDDWPFEASCSTDLYLTLWCLTTPIVVVPHRQPLNIAFYIFIQQIPVLNILNMVYTLRFFPLQNAVCFIILTYLVPVLFTFYTHDMLKLKKKFWHQKVNSNSTRFRSSNRHRFWYDLYIISVHK